VNFAHARYTASVSLESLNVVRLQHRFGVATVGQVVIAVWEDESVPTMAMFRELLGIVQHLRQGAMQTELIMLSVVAERAGVPAPALRKVSAEGLLLSDLFVVVHEGGSIRAALVRALCLTSVLTMTTKGNLQISASVSEAAALVSRCAVSKQVHAGVLDACVRELRNRMFVHED